LQRREKVRKGKHLISVERELGGGGTTPGKENEWEKDEKGGSSEEEGSSNYGKGGGGHLDIQPEVGRGRFHLL